MSGIDKDKERPKVTPPAGQDFPTDPDLKVDNLLSEIEGEFAEFERALSETSPGVEEMRPDERFRHLEILLETSRILGSSLELGKLLALMLDRVLEVTRGERAFVFLTDETGNLRQNVGRSAAGDRIREGEAQVSMSIVSRVLKSGKPFWATDVLGEDELSVTTSIAALSLRTIICVPLLIREAVTGVLYVDSQALSSGLSKRDFLLIEALASLAALAIENAKLYSTVIHDAVTGAFNYGYIQVRIGEEIERCRRSRTTFAAILLQLTNLRGINREHGSTVGSAVLKELHRLLAAELRQVDILGRHGPDEFAIILVDTPASEGAIVARRLKKRVEKHSFAALPQPTPLRTHVGVVIYPGTGLSGTDSVLVALQEALRRSRDEPDIDGIGAYSS
ncbi:MAG: GGDEF domain-containing protein [Candidatus Schekmanbacteria bacterium]|nr:GGDEF domain-containing protein [Candidatus Schekmanbacteria bacterium]